MPERLLDPAGKITLAVRDFMKEEATFGGVALISGLALLSAARPPRVQTGILSASQPSSQ